MPQFRWRDPSKAQPAATQEAAPAEHECDLPYVESGDMWAGPGATHTCAVKGCNQLWRMNDNLEWQNGARTIRGRRQ